MPFLLALSCCPCFRTCFYFKTPKTLTTKDTKDHEGLDFARRFVVLHGTAGSSIASLLGMTSALDSSE